MTNKKSTINVRSIEESDMDSVRRICFEHFRSLAPSAVGHFFGEHFRDFFFFMAITKMFVSWLEIGLLVVMFTAYLFARAYVEMECYIRQHCPDLRDVATSYLSDPKGHFWVAEADCGDGSNGKSEILGCIGLLPYRGNESVGQLMRLVVGTKSRRQRVGSRLLAQLENFAIAKGYSEISLFTNNLNTSHMMFVRLHGFETLQIVRRGLMRGDLIQWRKFLVKNDDPMALRHRSETIDLMD
eukprot:Lankesteria_metandrocarpae@DN5494_c0_g1_i1.p1